MSADLLSLNRLVQELDQSVALIEQHDAFKAKEQRYPELLGNTAFTDSNSLLDKCEKLVLQNKSGKPQLRLIHHFACSGGTLISKCLAAQPNVFVLSEVHPFSLLHLGEKAKYLPTDITSQARYANFPAVDTLAAELFLLNIQKTEQHVSQQGGKLVLRVHNHTDYCVGNAAALQERVSQLLAEHFELIQLVTVRDPIDAYRSLQENNWLHFEPATFDEYCQRFALFLQHMQDIPLIRYEDFVSSPEQIMRDITGLLQLPFNDTFTDTYELFNLSGDSGRSGGVISPRARKVLSDELLAEIAISESYKQVAARLNY